MRLPFPEQMSRLFSQSILLRMGRLKEPFFLIVMMPFPGDASPIGKGGVNELPDSSVRQCQVLLPGCSLS